jgi:alpha/beta superfamily hydrolase
MARRESWIRSTSFDMKRRTICFCALLAGCGGAGGRVTGTGGSDGAPFMPDDAAVSDTSVPDKSSATFLPGEKLETLPTRPSVTISFAFARPAHPTAAVILLAGSDGVLALSSSGIGSAADNFVVRTRQQYLDAGFMTAVPDVPSDHPSGLGNGYRTGDAEAEDLQPVIAWLRARAKVPVWLVGTSRGTISAANVAARLGIDGPDGIVLTSSISTGPNATLYDIALAKITAPTLFVHNKEDACPASPFANVAMLRTAFTSVMQTGFQPFDGGTTPVSEPCGPLSYHGYYGLDDKVVPAIVQFISAH